MQIFSPKTTHFGWVAASICKIKLMMKKEDDYAKDFYQPSVEKKIIQKVRPDEKTNDASF